MEQTLVYKPKIGTWGRVNFTSAEVSYQSQESSTVLTCQSSEPGTAFILSAEDYEKRFSMHYVSFQRKQMAIGLRTLPFRY